MYYFETNQFHSFQIKIFKFKIRMHTHYIHPINTIKLCDKQIFRIKMYV